MIFVTGSGDVRLKANILLMVLAFSLSYNLLRIEFIFALVLFNCVTRKALIIINYFATVAKK